MDLDTLKNLIMNVINGKASPNTSLVQSALERTSNLMAESKYLSIVTEQVNPLKSKIQSEISELIKLKETKKTTLQSKQQELNLLSGTIDNLKKRFDEIKKSNADKKEQLITKLSKLKAQGKTFNQENNADTEVRIYKEELINQQDAQKNIQNEIDNINKDISDIEGKIDLKSNEIEILLAQINPDVALAKSKVQIEQARRQVDTAITPESKELAEKELEKYIHKESEFQRISDEHQRVVDGVVNNNEPKMMQLRAEYQVMDSSVTAIEYLVAQITTLGTSLTTTPTTIVAGSATGTPNPIYVSLFTNVLYGYAWAILSNAKAASIRFLALAQEMNYTPTVEMDIINKIAPTELALSGLLGMAPAGVKLI